MAAFRGTVQGHRGEASRLGHGAIETTAATWDATFDVRLFNRNGVPHAAVTARGLSQHAAQSRQLYSGPATFWETPAPLPAFTRVEWQEIRNALRASGLGRDTPLVARVSQIMLDYDTAQVYADAADAAKALKEGAR